MYVHVYEKRALDYVIFPFNDCMSLHTNLLLRLFTMHKLTILRFLDGIKVTLVTFNGG